jgi:hypothetical protein
MASIAFLEVLIIAQPAAHLANPFAAQVELPRAPTRIGNRQNRQRMTPTNEDSQAPKPLFACSASCFEDALKQGFRGRSANRR